MALDVDPRAADVTHARASAVVPFVILTVVILGLSVAAYYWPEMQHVLSSPTPSGTPPVSPPSQP